MHFQGTQQGIGGTSGFRGTQVEKHCLRTSKVAYGSLFIIIFLITQATHEHQRGFMSFSMFAVFYIDP